MVDMARRARLIRALDTLLLRKVKIMSWYKIPLTRDQASGAINPIQKTFIGIYMANLAPKGMALLMNDSSDPNKPPIDTWFYLTPVAAQYCQPLIQQYGSQSCQEPDPSETKFCGGDNAFMSDWRGSQGNTQELKSD